MVDFLNGKRKVYVVRMMADCEIIEQNEEWTKFDKRFKAISTVSKVPFYDYTTGCDQYTFYDGSHMELESANRYSIRSARDIKDYLDGEVSVNYSIHSNK